MRIGLVRHFPVDCTSPWLMSANEFREWAKQYDCSPVKIGKAAVDFYPWTKCYSSDLPRAIETAQQIYSGTITRSELLREVPITPVFDSKLRLPHSFWLMAGRIAWRLSHQSQPETIQETQKRVKKFVDGILNEDNVLIVTHGFLMVQIQKELIQAGFSGEIVRVPACGRIYVFEKVCK